MTKAEIQQVKQRFGIIGNTEALSRAIDVFRNRQREKVARANQLRKQYYEKRDDSDKLKLDTVDED